MPLKKPTPYLIITNISKRQNVRNLIQIGASFGVTTIFVVGQKNFNFDVCEIDDHDNKQKLSSDMPTAIIDGVRQGRIKIIRFDKLEDCVKHIKSLPCNTIGSGEHSKIQSKSTEEKRTVQILGVEIDPSSVNLESEPFSGCTAFMMGNEGQGMTSKQMSLCDGFVRISQYGGGTCSLNVSVAAGLVLHRFFHWSRGDDVLGQNK